MIFSLDVRRARKGDCFLLHFGSTVDPGLIIIDGGPASVYKPHLEPRIDEIRTARQLAPADPLPVDLLMVSHVDDDHIRGILDLTREEIGRQDARQPLKLNVLDFWHNSFDAIIGPPPKELTAAFSTHFGAAASNGGGMSDLDVEEVETESEEEAEVVQSGLRVLASIEQGFRLRLDAERLAYPHNSDFGGELILAKENSKTQAEFGDLTLTIVGPMQPELLELHAKQDDWLKALEKKGKSPPAALAAYIDRSVANLSSLVVLAELAGKTILLTGDARGDKILEGLELAGLLADGETMKVDVLKVPHHGQEAGHRGAGELVTDDKRTRGVLRRPNAGPRPGSAYRRRDDAARDRPA
jgi:hypothetical protein